MPKKPAEQLYDVTRYQQIIWFQEKFAIQKSISNIPFIVTFKKKLDFDLLQKALEIEVQRNDALRVMGYKEKGKVYQYFKDSVEIGKVPYVSFQGKSEEEEIAYFQKISNKAISYCKGLSYKFVFFTDHKGQDGFYYVQHHVMNDTGGLLITVNDLMQVYAHLADGKEMPKDLGSFKNVVIKQNESESNQAKIDGDIAFFRQYFKDTGEPVYMTPYKDDLLKKYRIKTKKPDIKCANAMAMYAGKTHIQRLEITGELYQQIMDACRECKTSVQNFFYFLIRLQAYRMSGEKACMQNILTSGNRATLVEKRSPGMMLNSSVIHYPYEGEKTLQEVFGQFQALLNELYKHKTLGGLNSLDYLREALPHKMTEFYMCGSMSVVPVAFDLDPEYGIQITWLPPQVLPSPCFPVIVHDISNDRIQINFQYTLKFIKDEVVTDMFKDLLKVASVMAQHTDWTEDQIIEACK